MRILNLFLIFFCGELSAQNFSWAKQIGGSNNDRGTSVACDASGNIYVTGGFFGTADFDPGAGTAMLTAAGNEDVFICKLSSSGNLIWARQLSGTANERGNAIAVDASGNVFVVGYFDGTVDFDPGASSSNLTTFAVGYFDAFICKLDLAGNFLWAKQVGGTQNDAANGVSLNSGGHPFITGYFTGTADLDPSTSVSSMTSAGMGDIFILLLNASGNFVGAKQMGGALQDYGNAINVDAGGNIYTTGIGMGDFDPGAASYSLNGGSGTDIFVSKLDPAGNFVWAVQVNGPIYEEASSMVRDAAGNIYVTGYFEGTGDFDPGAGSNSISSTGFFDAYVLKLNDSGTYVWAKQFSGAHQEVVNSIALDALGNVYAAGFFRQTTDFDPGLGTFTLSTAMDREIFISKLDASGNFVAAWQMGGGGDDEAIGICVDAFNNIYTSGYFGSSAADFDPGAGTFNMNSTSGDIFISKLSPSTPQSILSLVQKKAMIDVFPNPTSGKIKIMCASENSSEEGRVKVYNLYGELVYSQQFGSEEKILDLSDLQEGIYFIRSGEFSKKIIRD